ncbi:PREDICTED: putative F-box protein At4g11580 [Camelina sativa]|uniref:F-box protein At4g11580 n=1 Tax=Camelina sativa TaxID=90675 RepID=A0ABM0X1Y2_CAMSA|nr:PREDICTED: putative F-box protein At4g11580 [Camelina sativa]
MSGWENMDRNILAKIFGMLNVIDIIMGASRVCISWFLASHNRTLWKSINLTDLKPISLDDNPKKAEFLLDNNDEERRYQLRDILMEITKFSNTITTDLFLDYYYYIQEEDLAIIAERMPNIKKIAFTLWCDLNENSFQFTFSRWKNLQTLILTQPRFEKLDLDLRAIGDNCQSLTNLKLIRTLTRDLAEQLVCNFSTLKRLSFQCASVCNIALLSLIINHHNLKILNLSHCIYAEIINEIFGDEDELGLLPSENIIQTGTQNLDAFIVCSKDCKVCKEVWDIAWRGAGNNYKYYMFQNKKWKTDAIKELEF